VTTRSNFKSKLLALSTLSFRVLQPPTLPVLPQTFEMVLSQYIQHPEYKSLAPDGQACKADSHGLLKRYPVTASEFHLIGKETERSWEQADDISTLLPSLLRYQQNKGTAKSALRERLQKTSIASLEKETGLSRHTILRARRGELIHPRTLQVLQVATKRKLQERERKRTPLGTACNYQPFSKWYTSESSGL
jgi:hypothetical protein